MRSIQDPLGGSDSEIQSFPMHEDFRSIFFFDFFPRSMVDVGG
jgi:hypothetical protein